jgi:pimeloyl-ACP methyl ester carboxylesterase
MHLRLPESRGSFVSVRRSLRLRPDVHLPRLPARERKPVREPVMHVGAARSDLPRTPAARKVGRIVTLSLVGGLIAALALVVGPVAGAPEHVISATVLLTFSASWVLLGTLSMLRTAQPQRWAFAPASFMALAGAALLVFAPSGVSIDALGWVWPPLFLALVAGTVVRVHRHLHSRVRFWVVYPLLSVYALCAVGGGYQTIREAHGRRTYVAPGQLVDVGGHRLHLHCAGSGSPTVVLESGLGQTGAYWGWIWTALVSDSTVCAYDRAGRGWSDPASAEQDGAAVAADLRTLLDRAHVPGPFVLVGHSSGAQYVRIFAGRYPERVVGMVLLDAQPAEAFEELPSYPAFYSAFRRISALLPSLARLGVGRLIIHADLAQPAPSRDMERLHHVSARLYRSLRDEFAALPTSLVQARAFQSLGNRPLVVVTATEEALAGWLPLQDRMATLSTNSSHRVVPYSHDALVTDQIAAQTSIQAIRDVVRAVRLGERLEKVVAGATR